MQGKSKRGFASMTPEKRKEIATLGGKAAHEQGTAHKWSSTEAAEAGSRGGKAAHEQGTAHKWSSTEAAEAGRRGGKVSRGGGRKSKSIPNPKQNTDAAD